MLASRCVATAQEKFALLNCRRLPGRLNTTETAVLLGVQDHDVPILTAAKLLVPLGKPAANAPSISQQSKLRSGPRIQNGYRARPKCSQDTGIVRITVRRRQIDWTRSSPPSR